MWCVCHGLMSCQFLIVVWYFCCLGRFLWLLCTFFVLLGIDWTMPPGPSHHLLALAQLQGTFCDELLFAWCCVGSTLPSVIKAVLSCLMSEFTDVWAVHKPFWVVVRFYYQHQLSSPAFILHNLSKLFCSCHYLYLGFLLWCMKGYCCMYVLSCHSTHVK